MWKLIRFVGPTVKPRDSGNPHSGASWKLAPLPRPSTDAFGIGAPVTHDQSHRGSRVGIFTAELISRLRSGVSAERRHPRKVGQRMRHSAKTSYASEVLEELPQQIEQRRLKAVFNWRRVDVWHSPKVCCVAISGRRPPVFRRANRHMAGFWNGELLYFYRDLQRSEFRKHHLGKVHRQGLDEFPV